MSAARISVIVPVLPSSIGLEETLASLASQSDPPVEAIVENGESWSAAVNAGLARAGGNVLGCLDPGNRLLAGASTGIESNIDPARGRHVVMGEAYFAVDGMDDAPVSHPAEYGDHAAYLAIWERGFDTLAHTSLFWHRSALAETGPFAGESASVAAYDFVCRLGARHAIHKVGQAWSVVRVHAQPGLETEAQTLAACVAASRRYWGSWVTPQRWRCEFSYWRYRRESHDRARHHARKAEAARTAGRRFAFAASYLMTWLYAPQLARERLRGR